MFKALVVEKIETGTHAAVREISYDDLPAGDVTVSVEYSTVNYKDGLCIGPGGGLVRTYPHVPGIDFAGTVESSDDPRYKAGDAVVLTGWRVGEKQWGGYSQKARVKADYLVPLPEGLNSPKPWLWARQGLRPCWRLWLWKIMGCTPNKPPCWSPVRRAVWARLQSRF